MTILKFLIGLLVVACLVFVISRRTSPCSAWLSWLIEMDNPFCPNHRAGTIVKNSGIEEGMVVLDAGCGPGRVTIPASIKVGPSGKVVALDIQKEMLQRVREKAEAVHLANIEYLNAGLGEGQLGQSEFDRILLVTVLGEIPNQEVALKEIFHALKPNGILSITETVFDPDYKSRSTVRQLAETAGFQEKEAFGNIIGYTLNFTKP